MHTPRETVLISQAVHPDWNVQDHLDYLDEQYTFGPAEHTVTDPATVERWMEDNRRSGLVDSMREAAMRRAREAQVV